MSAQTHPARKTLAPAAIAAAFFALAALYSVVTPLFESPDELWHVPFVTHLAQTWQLPVQDPAHPQPWQQEGSQPPLYYALAALLTAPLPADDLPALTTRNPHAAVGQIAPDGNANIVLHTPAESWPWRGAVLAVHLARLVSAVLGTASVLVVYALARLLWPANRPFALISMAFVAFNPMFIFMSASVNNDNLIILLAALLLGRLVALRCGMVKLTTAQAALLGLLGGLAALSKISGLGLLALAGLTLLAEGLRQKSWRATVGYPALAGAVALAVAGWWYARNLSLYGDWSGTQIMVQMMGARPVPPTAAQLLSEVPGLARSFWGLFGYFSVPMPAAVYTLLNLLLVAGAAGWLKIAAAGKRRAQFIPPGLRAAWPVLLGWLLILLAGFIQWTLRTPATQGRLLFPALAALAPLWAAGWLALAPSKLRGLPAAAMLALSLWVPWGVIGPAYARPPELARLPANAEPLNVTFGPNITLLAVVPPQNSVRPGELLPLSLIWRGKNTPPANYSVFTHLVDENGLIVAQRDSLHGGGNYPSGQWTPNTTFADTRVLQLPATAFAPAQAQLVVGLYNPATGERLPAGSGGDSVTVARVSIAPNPGEFPNPQQLHFADGISLVGYTLDRRQAAPGQTVTLSLFWQAQATPAQNYKVFVHLVDENDRRAAQHDSEPQAGAAPTGGWQPGQTIRDDHPLHIAPDAPPGPYHLLVGLYHPDSGQRLPLQFNGAARVQADSVTLPGIKVE